MSKATLAPDDLLSALTPGTVEALRATLPTWLTDQAEKAAHESVTIAQALSDDRVDRRVKRGNKDRGDLTGHRTQRGPL